MGKKITALPDLGDFELDDGTLFVAVVTGPQDSNGTPTKHTVKVTLGQLKEVVGSGGGTIPPLTDMGLVEKLWEFQTPGQEQVYSSPIGPVSVYAGTGPGSNRADAVLFVSWDWYLYAVDAATGALLWRKAAQSNCYGRPQAGDVNDDGDTEIFFPSHDGSVWSVNYDGTNRWRFYNAYDREGNGTATAVGNYFLQDDTKAWAENAFMRRTTAPFEINAYVRFLDGPNAFVPGTEDPVSGIAPTDRHISQNNEGNKLWISEPWATMPNVGDTYKIIPRYVSDRTFMHAGTLVNEGAGNWWLYLTGFDNHCYKINADTGEIAWKYATMENIEPYPLVQGDGVYIVSIDGFTRKLSRADGSLTWASNTGQCDAFVTMDIQHESKPLMVSSRNNRVYRVDPYDGNVMAASTDTGGDIDSSSTPVFDSINGRVVFINGSDDGSVWCFDRFMDTVWQFYTGPSGLNSSPVFHDVNGDGNPEVLIADMRGTVFCINIATGKPIGVLYHKGGIEGVPLYADIDGDGNMEYVVTTLEGWVVCYRFVNGSPYTHSDNEWPGEGRWRGYQFGDQV